MKYHYKGNKAGPETATPTEQRKKAVPPECRLGAACTVTRSAFPSCSRNSPCQALYAQVTVLPAFPLLSKKGVKHLMEQGVLPWVCR